MKILMVSEFMPYEFLGGLARHAITLGNQLIELGHSVDILGNGKYRDDRFMQEMGFKGSVYLDDAISRPALIRRVERYLKVYPAWLHILVAKRIATAIRKYAKSYDIVHYHGHYPHVANYLPSDINLVVTHHDYSVSCPKKTFLKKEGLPCSPGIESRRCAECHLDPPDGIRKWLIRRGVEVWRSGAKKAINRHKHIFVSRRLADLNLAVLDEKNAPVSVVHNFVDCRLINDYVAVPFVKKPGDKKVRVIISNSMDPHKGIKEFLRAADENGVLNENIEVVIAGGGSQKAQLEADYAARGIVFLGHVPYVEAINAVCAADIYLLPSICEESCSTGVLEGIYLNKDVRALNRGGTPELAKYAVATSQVKLYEDMQSLASSLKDKNIFSSDIPMNTAFGACVAEKAKDILGVYRQ